MSLRCSTIACFVLTVFMVFAGLWHHRSTGTLIVSDVLCKCNELKGFSIGVDCHLIGTTILSMLCSWVLVEAKIFKVELSSVL